MYEQLLKKLKNEIATIESSRRKKRWKPHQKIMVDFINGATSKAVFTTKDITITLFKGDSKKGFMHILLKHYQENDLKAMDIVNIFDIYLQGIELANEGVSNKHFIVYMKLSNLKELRLILNPINDNNLVVTAYRKS